MTQYFGLKVYTSTYGVILCNMNHMPTYEPIADIKNNSVHHKSIHPHVESYCVIQATC